MRVCWATWCKVRDHAASLAASSSWSNTQSHLQGVLWKSSQRHVVSTHVTKTSRSHWNFTLSALGCLRGRYQLSQHSITEIVEPSMGPITVFLASAPHVYSQQVSTITTPQRMLRASEGRLVSRKSQAIFNRFKTWGCSNNTLLSQMIQLSHRSFRFCMPQSPPRLGQSLHLSSPNSPALLVIATNSVFCI